MPDAFRPSDEPFAGNNETDRKNDFDFMLEDHPWAEKWYRMGKLKIVRKPPEVMLAMRRIVYDNDFQPKDLVGERFQRWLPKSGGAWKQESPTVFATQAKEGAAVEWLRYRHLVVEGEGSSPRLVAKDPKVQLITDLYGYNKVKLAPAPFSGPVELGRRSNARMHPRRCRAQGRVLDGAEPGRGPPGARFDLASGQCTLFRETLEGKREELAVKETRMKAKGSYQLRFANFGARLTVWVDRELPFDKGHDYDPPEVPRPGEFKDINDSAFEDAIAKRRGPTKNDLEPASIGVNGSAVQVKQLRLWRDTYYDRSDQYLADLHSVEGEIWDAYRRLPPKTYYVQPGHYLCLGDNSTASADSRDWGLVPERLLLGRAHMVYYPFNRAGPIK